MILGGTSFLVVLSIFLGAKNVVNSDPYEYFTDGLEIKKTQVFLEKAIGGTMGPEIFIQTGQKGGVKDPAFLKKVADLQDWLEEFSFVNKTISIVNIIKELNQTFNGGKREYYKLPTNQKAIAELLFLYNMSIPQGMGLTDRVNLDESGMRVSVLWNLNDSITSLKYMRMIEKKGKDLGLDLYNTGRMPLYKEMNAHVVDTFITSILTAIILVSLLMWLIFQSKSMALLSMLPNLIPLCFGAGILFLLGKDIDMGNAIVASISLGIAVDDTIHFLANFKKYKLKGLGHTDAIKKVLFKTGPALVLTTVILIFSFGCFMLASFIPNIYFGILTACTLATALIVDLVFLPALLLKER